MANVVRVWDLPTRLFHWSLVACVAGLIITGHVGGQMINWHARLGYAVLALVLFRLAWGFLGGRWSRFSSFGVTPGRVMGYLRGGNDEDRIGHNPLGALSVFAMLSMLLVQVATGLVSDDEIAFTGPLNSLVSSARGLAATAFHKQVGQWLVVALVVLHVAAIVYYRIRRQQNLVRPMITGDKVVPIAVRGSRDDARTRLTGALVLGLSAGFVAWLVKLAG